MKKPPIFPTCYNVQHLHVYCRIIKENSPPQKKKKKKKNPTLVFIGIVHTSVHVDQT